MKKLFFTFAVTAICAMASAQTASIADIDIMPGQTASFTIVVNVGDNEFSGIEFTKMQLPEGLTMVENGVIPNPDWDKTAYCDFGIDTDGTIIGAFNSQKDIAIPQNQDFALGTMEIEAAADLEVGTSLTITIPAGKLKFVPGSIPVENEISFKVNVSDAVILDENSTIAPVAAEGVKVRVKRTINANEWSTICLPFDLTATQFTEIFGEGTKLAYFTDYKATKESDKVTGIEVEFADFPIEDVIYGGYPYIIKATKDVTEFVVNETVIYDELSAAESESKTSRPPKKPLGTFNGTYVKTQVPANSLFLSEGKFWYSTGLTQMKAFRAYFTFNDKLSDLDAASSRVKFFVTDGDQATEIQIPELMPNDGEYYNLNGLRVETPAKGVYIKDGKKVVVK